MRALDSPLKVGFWKELCGLASCTRVFWRITSFLLAKAPWDSVVCLADFATHYHVPIHA